MDAIIVDVVKAWGPPGIIAALMTYLMFYFLGKSEEREAKKDLRIQLLENIVLESYDERIEAANQISEAIHSNSTALTALISEIRSRKNV